MNAAATALAAVDAQKLETSFGPSKYELTAGTSSIERLVSDKRMSAEIVSVDGEAKAIVHQMHPFLNAALLVTQPVGVSEIEAKAAFITKSVREIKEDGARQIAADNAALLTKVADTLKIVAADVTFAPSLRKVERPADFNPGVQCGFNADCD